VHDLDRIEQMLGTKSLKPSDFERFAVDQLSQIFPGLTSIRGGTDWGRDADISVGGGSTPPRVLVTSSRTLDGVRKNMNGGLRSMKQHGVAVDRIVLVNPAELSTLDRVKLQDSAQKRGARLDVADVFDRGWLASQLRRDGFWRQKLLGLKSDPITVSRRAPEIAESPWAHLPLVGRTEEVSELRRIEGDLVLDGPPGVGKSRLAEELTDALFIDAGADLSQVADDLRWLLPSSVVVDDAALHQPLVDRLRSLRRNESDLFSYRIILICWPDEAEDLSHWLPGATHFRVDLLERPPIDETIRSMGVTGRLARQEILDQAEGRLGWAISLADPLVRSNDPESLLHGRALYGQVSRFLKRSGADDLVLDVLGIVGAVGGIVEREVKTVSTTAGRARHDVARALQSAAHSGLVDVSTRYSHEDDRNLRHYSVRPPMLMNAVVAERFFRVTVAAIDLAELYEEWPDHRVAVTRAAVEAALLGAPGARSAAEGLFRRITVDDAETLADAELDHRRALIRSYALLDERAADQVLEIVRASVDAQTERSERAGHTLEPAVDLAHLIAARYGTPAAIEVMLDACLVDARLTNPNPGHPLRKLSDLIHDFHPDLPLPTTNRPLVADVLCEWLGDADVEAKWAVAAELFASLLSFALSATFGEPADGMRFQVIQAVLLPADMEAVYDNIWPRLRGYLAKGRDGLAAVAIDAMSDWLRIGSGYDRPFGNEHPAASIAKAGELGARLAEELAASEYLSVGSLLHLASVTGPFGLDVKVTTDDTYEPFFRDNERNLNADWHELDKRLIEDVQAMARSWAAEPVDAVITRLSDLSAQIEAAKLRWPDRVWVAAMALGESVDQPEVWLRAAIDSPISGCARAFLTPAIAKGGLKPSDFDSLLSVPVAMWASIGEVLTDRAEVPEWLADAAIAGMDATGFQMLSLLSLREELTVETWRLLLTEARPEVRGVAAAAFADGRIRQHAPIIPPQLDEAWRTAILTFRPGAAPGVTDYECAELFAFMARDYPEILAMLVLETVEEAGPSGAYGSISHSSWRRLHELPAKERLHLWQYFADEPAIAWIMQRHLIGSDVEWLRELIQSQALTPVGALGQVSAFGPSPPLEDLARLLVPLGVPPGEIAYLAQMGTHTGSQSENYQKLVDRFVKWSQSDDTSVRAVGEAAVPMYSALRVDALEREKRRRIRGQE
jgi:hypothetical protein